MDCKHCGYTNDEDAIYCIQCGRRMDGQLICPSCGMLNDSDSKFCKECGTALVSQNVQKKTSSSLDKMKAVRWIMSVISLSYAGFILLYCFGICFAPFIEGTNVGYNLFEIISNLQHFRPKPSGVYGSDFYYIGGNLPNFICLVGICISLLGCFICLLYGMIKGISSGSKKIIPNLNKVAFISTCFLLGGLLICGTVCKTYANSELFGQPYSQLSLGGIVLSGVILGLIFHFSEYIKEFVLDIIDGMPKEEILNRAFKLGEAVLLVVLVFNVCSTFIQFLPTGYLSSPQQQYSIMAFFCELSASISSTINRNPSFQFKGSSVATGFYLAMGMGIMWILLLIVSLTLFVIRLNNAKKSAKPCLVSSSIMVTCAIIEMVLFLVSVRIFDKRVGVFSVMFSNSYYGYRAGIGANCIVFIIFAFLLLGLTITWKIVLSKRKGAEVTENDL